MTKKAARNTTKRTAKKAAKKVTAAAPVSWKVKDADLFIVASCYQIQQDAGVVRYAHDKTQKVTVQYHPPIKIENQLVAERTIADGLVPLDIEVSELKYAGPSGCLFATTDEIACARVNAFFDYAIDVHGFSIPGYACWRLRESGVYVDDNGNEIPASRLEDVMLGAYVYAASAMWASAKSITKKVNP